MNGRDHTFPRRLPALLLLGALGACTVVGPDYVPPPEPPLPAAWETADAAAAREEIGAWWQRFNDPVLNELVDRGARQNLSIETAGLRIVQARAALGISDALLFPQQQQVTGIHGVIRCGSHLVRPQRNRHRGPSQSG